ncbi:MAG: NrsF family protein [Polyangiaceae bacterium]|jgi:hypothetical protein|nr:NrsF family protein [Polyangiaceae bacterium]
MEPLSPEVRERLMAQLSARPAPRRSDVVRRRALLLVAGAAPVVLAVVMRGVGRQGRSTGLVLASVVVASLVAALGTWWAVFPGRSTLGRPRPWLLASAAVIPVALLLFAVATVAVWPEARVVESFDARVHVPCVVMTLVLAAAPLGAMLFLARRSDPVEPAATGAALGASAGTWAGVAMTLGCEYSDLFHLGVSHILPIVGLAAVGAVAGARVVGLRRTRQ